MSIYSYIRKDYPVSTIEQMEVALEWRCDNLFVENQDLEADEKLNEMLAGLAYQDQLIIYDFSVFGKSLLDLSRIFEKLAEKNIKVICSNSKVDFNNEDFYLFLTELMGLEVKVKRDKAKNRIAKAKACGKEFGRPRISPNKIEKNQALYYGEKKTLRMISKECEVSLGTVHKYISLNKEEVRL